MERTHRHIPTHGTCNIKLKRKRVRCVCGTRVNGENILKSGIRYIKRKNTARVNSRQGNMQRQWPTTSGGSKSIAEHKILICGRKTV